MISNLWKNVKDKIRKILEFVDEAFNTVMG